MHRALAASLAAMPALLLLAGCGIAGPIPTPTSAPPRVRSTTPATPAPPVSTFALACVPPDDAVMTWLRNMPQGNPTLPASRVTMVDIGTGLQQGSDWWIVAAPSATAGTANFWLTTAPASGGQWIGLGDGSQNSWDQYVSWTGDRLARGHDAQNTAAACLNGPQAG
jgi:predicted small lipoprotein YifL